MPTTLQSIKSYVDSLPTFPLDRNQVFYGNTDKTVRPLVLFSDLDVIYDRTSCGRALGEGSFTIHVLTDPLTGSLAQAEDLSAGIDALIDSHYLSAGGGNLLAMLSRYTVHTEPAYVFHVSRTYALAESA